MSIYEQSAHIFMGSLVAAFLLAGVAGIPAIAQEKAVAGKTGEGKPIVTVRAENDKVRAWETRYRPGDENASHPSTRAIRVLKGGTLLWTYADGKTETKQWKTGDVMLLGPTPQYRAKNVGKSDVVIYVVGLK